MEIVIKIPEEFESHFNNDKFKDSLGRIIFDIKQCNRHGSEYDALSGNYEIETLEMLKDALEDAAVIPKGHGDLKYTEKLKKAFITWSKAVHGNFADSDIASIVYNSPTIVKADKED